MSPDYTRFAHNLERLAHDRQQTEELRGYARERLNSIVAEAPCADARGLLDWCTKAKDCLAEYVRLDGGDWSASSAPGERLARAALNRATALKVDAETLAVMTSKLPTDQSIMSGDVARAMLERLAYWCHATVTKPTADADLASERPTVPPLPRLADTVTDVDPVRVQGGTGTRDEDLTDRQRDILVTMLEHEIASERRREKGAEIVKLYNRTHKSATYGRDFSALVHRGYLKSREGRQAGYWLTPEGKAAAERLCQ